MNELIDSEPELYAGDIEDMAPTVKKSSQKDKLKSELASFLNNQAAQEDKLSFKDDEISLEDP